MITVLRNKFQKKAFRIIIWSIVIIMALFTFIPLKMNRSHSMHAIALINNREISELEYRRRIHIEEQYLSYFKQQLGDFADQYLMMVGLSNDASANALNALIQEQLLLDAAQKTHIVVSDEYAQRCLNDAQCATKYLGSLVPPYLYDNQGVLTRKALMNYLRHQGMTIENFETAIEETLSRNLFIQFINAASYVTQANLQEQLLREASIKHFEILHFSLKPYMEAAQKDIKDEKEARKRAQEDLFNQIREASTQLNKGLDVIAKEFKATREKDLTVMAEDKHAWEGAQKRGLPVMRMKNMIHAGSDTFSLTENGGYLVVLKKIEAQPEDLKLKSTVFQHLNQELAQVTANAFIANLRKSGTIELYSPTLS